MEIRAYRSADHDAVVELWRRVFPSPEPRNDPVKNIQHKLAVQPELFLLALIEFRVVGTCMAGFDGHRGWVYLLGVAPEHRRAGVGRALMRRAESLLTRFGCPKLNLQVLATNPEAVGFYERLGYRVEERISMGKLLPPGET